MPQLKAVLVGLSWKLEGVEGFSIRGDVMPDVLARRWITQLNYMQWCLAQACKNAGESVNAQQAMEQFTTISRDSETATQLLAFSRIIYI